MSDQITVAETINNIGITADELQLSVTQNVTDLLTVDGTDTILVESETVNIISTTETQNLAVTTEVINLMSIAEQGPAGIQGEQGVQGIQGIQGIAGPAGVFYVHTQASPATEWIANHNLGFKPTFGVSNTGGQTGIADVTHISANQARVYFAVATAGEVRFV